MELRSSRVCFRGWGIIFFFSYVQCNHIQLLIYVLCRSPKQVLVTHASEVCCWGTHSVLSRSSIQRASSSLNNPTPLLFVLIQNRCLSWVCLRGPHPHVIVQFEGRKPQSGEMPIVMHTWLPPLSKRNQLPLSPFIFSFPFPLPG